MAKIKNINITLSKAQSIDSDGLDALASMSDNIESGDIEASVTVSTAYKDALEKLQEKFPSLSIASATTYLRIKDTEILRVLLSKGFGDGIGITESSLAGKTSIPALLFKDNKTIKEFNELSLFYDLKTLENGCFQNTNIEHVDLSNIECIVSGAFYDCQFLKPSSLTNVKTIGNQPFYQCYNFATDTNGNLYLPNLESIGVSAFCGGNTGFMQGIKKIVSLGKITSFPSESGNGGIFRYNAKLEEANIPTAITSLPGGIFYYCISLKKVNGVSNVTSIGDNAFINCVSLNDIDIDFSKITSIGYGCFYNCSSLVIEDLNLSSLTNLGKDAFGGLLNNEGVKIKKISSLGSIGSIENGANNNYGEFRNCKLLEEVTFPSTLISIGHYAFTGCTSLKKVNFSTTQFSIGHECFYNNPIEEITNEEYIISLGQSAFNNAGAEGCGLELSLPNLQSIGRSAFKGCKFKKILDMGNVLTSLNSTGNNSMYQFGASALEYIKLPTSITSIDECSFYNCTSLTEVVIPSEITSIGVSAFYNCPLTGMEFEFPNCTSISNGAFKQTGSFKIKSLGEGCDIKGTASSAMGSFHASKITSINLNGVSTIGECAFYNCSELTSIGNTDTITSIGNTCFYGTTKLAVDIDLPALTTVVGRASFKLSGITGVKSLGSITALNGTTSSNLGMFTQCYSLRYAILPSTLTSIGHQDFAKCTSLKYVLLQSPSVVSIQSTTFESSKPIVFVQSSLLDDYKSATNWSTISGWLKAYTSVESIPSNPSGWYKVGDDLYEYRETGSLKRHINMIDNIDDTYLPPSGEYDFHFFKEGNWSQSAADIVDTDIELWSAQNTKWTMYCYIDDANGVGLDSDNTRRVAIHAMWEANPYNGLQFRGSAGGTTKLGIGITVRQSSSARGYRPATNVWITSDSDSLLYVSGYPKSFAISRDGNNIYASFDGQNWELLFSTVNTNAAKLVIGGYRTTSGTYNRFFTSDGKLEVAYIESAKHPMAEMFSKYPSMLSDG